MHSTHLRLLQRPLTRPDIMNLQVPPGEYRLQKFPKVEIGTDGEPRLG